MGKKRTGKAIIAMIMGLAILLFVQSLFAASDYALRDMSINRHYLFLGLALLLFLFGNELCIKNKLHMISSQITVISLAVGMVFLILPVLGRKDLAEVNRQPYMFSYFLIAFSACLLLVRNFFEKCAAGAKVRFDVIEKYIKEHIWLICLLMAVLIIAVLQSGSEPRWDGAYLYKWLYDMRLATIFNIEGLSFCGHINMAYAAINTILRFILGDLAAAMSVANIGLFLISVCCMYGIIKEIVKDRNDSEYTILAAIYAVSPFALGLVNYNYWDMWVIYLWPIVIYTAVRKRWVYHFVAAAILCFTKEPAVIAYAFYCLGIVCVDLKKAEKKKIQIALLNIVKEPVYWIMLLVGIIWLWVYIALPNWNGEGAFMIDFSYVLEKLKVFYVLNYNWLLAAAGAIAIIGMLKRKDEAIGILGPVIVSDLAFIIFSCVFKTVNHARYIDTHIVVLNLCAIIGVAFLNRQMGRYIVSMVFIGVMMFSNYRTWDPITLAVFKNYTIGDEVMISTSSEYLSDSMVYNQQYRYFDMALNRAMEDAVEKKGGIIIFPRILGRDWFFEGIYAEGRTSREEAIEINEQYWSQTKNKRVLPDNNHDNIIFEICNIDENSDVNMQEVLGNKTGYYFYIPCAGYALYQKISEQAIIVDEKDFDYKGWKVTRVELKAKEGKAHAGNIV